ncbi:MFS transporter [Candidatus Gracilibacteria bacterium]|nr:MFS transporter [Candidatus Gracilibacteria bacterium]
MSIEHAILGVIGLYPCSGYDIKREFEDGGAGLVWAIGFGSIYPKLEQLAHDGLVEVVHAQTSGRQKKQYELTADGWNELGEWLATAPAYPLPMRDELLLRMLFWGAARPDDRDMLVAHLQDRQRRSRTLLAYLEQWPHNGESLVSEYGMLVITYLRARLEAELQWIEATTTQLEGSPQPPAQDPRGLVPQQQERRRVALDRGDESGERWGSYLMRKFSFIALTIANAIAVLGNSIVTIAFPWLVLELTGSAIKTGVISAAIALGLGVGAFFGGTIVDRLGLKRASVVADSLGGLAIALIPLSSFSGTLTFEQLVVFAFVRALFQSPAVAARQSLIPDFAQQAGISLEQANATYQTLQRIEGFLGPILAGLLISIVGPTIALWGNVVTCIFASCIVASVHYERHNASSEPSFSQQLFAGLQFVWRDKLIFVIVFVIACTNMLDAPLLTVILPIYIRTYIGGSVDLGIIMAGFGGGAIIGAVLYGAIGWRLPRRYIFIGGFLLVGVPIWLLLLNSSFMVTAFALMCSGFGAGPVNPLVMTLIQERVPPQLRGRVFGVLTAIAFNRGSNWNDYFRGVDRIYYSARGNSLYCSMLL